jgi:hypothetical protein
MSGDGGLRDGMRLFFTRRRDPLLLDEDTATRLLAGRLEPADAPPGFAAVTRVIAVAAAPAGPGELAGEDAALAAYRTARRPAERPVRRARGLRLATLVTAGVLVLGGVAGAVSTGALPDGAQSVAHDALGSVGVSVPAPARSRTAVRPRVAARRPVSPSAPAHPAFRPRGSPAPPPPARRAAPSPSSPPPTHRPVDPRLVAACRAYLQGRISPTGGRAAANAYRDLAGRAGGPADIAGFCQEVVRGAGP